MCAQVSRARGDHQSWLRELEASQAAVAAAAATETDKAEDGSQLQQKQQQVMPQPPWPEPDFYRVLIVGQEGAPVGSGLDSDGSMPVHTVEYGTIVVAYER